MTFLQPCFGSHVEIRILLEQLNRLGVDQVVKVFSVGEITLLVAPPWRVPVEMRSGVETARCRCGAGADGGVTQ